MSTIDAVQLIISERKRQIEIGYTTQHDDDEHRERELAGAALCLLYEHTQMDAHGLDSIDDAVDWVDELVIKMRSVGDIHRLVVAGALIVAEIERLQRAEGS